MGKGERRAEKRGEHLLRAARTCATPHDGSGSTRTLAASVGDHVFAMRSLLAVFLAMSPVCVRTRVRAYTRAYRVRAFSFVCAMARLSSELFSRQAKEELEKSTRNLSWKTDAGVLLVSHRRRHQTEALGEGAAASTVDPRHGSCSSRWRRCWRRPPAVVVVEVVGVVAAGVTASTSATVS